MTLKELVKDPEIEKLEQFEKTRGVLRLPADIKPCIAKLLDGRSPGINDGINSFIVACELHRVGWSERKIEAALTRCGVRQSKVSDDVKSATTGRYNYGCPSLFSEYGLCLYKHRSECWWYRKIPKQNQKSHREEDFWRYGWPRRLNHAVSMVYQALGQIEKRKRRRAGDRLYVSRRQLSNMSGVSPRWVMNCCEKLKQVGLIEFKKGRQHKWYGEASKVQRIIPIPRPEVGK